MTILKGGGVTKSVAKEEFKTIIQPLVIGLFTLCVSALFILGCSSEDDISEQITPEVEESEERMLPISDYEYETLSDLEKYIYEFLDASYIIYTWALEVFPKDKDDLENMIIVMKIDKANYKKPRSWMDIFDIMEFIDKKEIDFSSFRTMGEGGSCRISGYGSAYRCITAISNFVEANGSASISVTYSDGGFDVSWQ